MLYDRFRLGFLSLIWGLLLPFGSFSQASLNLFSPNIPAEPIIQSIQYRIDSTDSLPIQRIAVAQTGWKQAAPNRLLQLGFTPHPVWCRLTLRQHTVRPRDYALSLTDWFADSVTLYQPLSNTHWQPHYAGDMVPFIQRELPTRYPSFYLQLADSTPKTYYVKIRSTQYQSYQFRALTRTVFDAQVLPDKEFAFFLGHFITQLIFYLCLLILMVNYPVLRAYAILSLASHTTMFFFTGIASACFPNSPYWANVSHLITPSLLVLSLSYYVVQVYQLTRTAPRLVTMYWVFSIISLLYGALTLVFRHAYITWALAAMMCIFFLFSFLLVPILYKRGLRPNSWYILAFALVILPYAYYFGHNAGFFGGTVPGTVFSDSFAVGVLLRTLFLMIMLWQATRARARADAELIQEQDRLESLRQLDQVKTDFFTNISHELRTPLTLLVSPLHELRQRFPTDALYDLMHRNAQRLLTLTNQLLDLARLDAGQLPLNRTATNLANDMRIWTAFFDSQAKSKAIHLTLEQNQAYWPAHYDADKLGKIMINLIANALKFTPDGGAVTVRGQYQSGGVTLVVSDTGIGIAPDVLPFIFNRFYQAKHVQQHLSMGTAEGTGIGLALINELIHLKGGSITVTSELGVGTTFTIALPIRPADEPIPDRSIQMTDVVLEIGHSRPAFVSPAIPIPTPKADMSHQPLLLLVEDNDDLRIYLRMVLAPTYQVIEASDGQQGLELALDRCPDLVLTDLMMPRLDGLELCQALRADLRTNHIPVVMLTAKAVLEDRLAGLETGADDYLTKPFIPTELHLRIRNLLQRQAAVRAFFQRSLTRVATPDSLTDQPVPDDTRLAFIDILYGIIDQYLGQPDFDVEALAAHTFMSSRNLNRKLNALVGLSARELISSRRLNHAVSLLRAGVSPTKVTEQVGFGSLSAFSRAFKAQFGYPPSMVE